MLATLISIHDAFFWVVLVAGALTLISGLLVLLANRGVKAADGSGAGSALAPQSAAINRIFRVLLWITAAVGLIQAIFGGLLYVQGCRPGEQLHFVYGGIVLLAIPVAFAYSDQKKVRRDIIIMTIAAAAIVGAAFRAFATGPGVCH